MAFKCPGSAALRQPEPEEIKCGSCGADAEIWTDEAEARCPACKEKVSRKEAVSSCLDWCGHARECAGVLVFEKYQEQKRKQKLNRT